MDDRADLGRLRTRTSAGRARVVGPGGIGPWRPNIGLGGAGRSSSDEFSPRPTLLVVSKLGVDRVGTLVEAGQLDRMMCSTSDSGVVVLDGGCCGTAHCDSSGGFGASASRGRAGGGAGSRRSGGVRVRAGCTTAAALAGRDIVAAVVGGRIT